MFRQYYQNRIILIACIIIISVILSSCGNEPKETEVKISKVASTQNRSNEPKCLTPVAGGEKIFGEGGLTVDATNSSDGYLYVKSTGENQDIKIQLNCDESVTYTYIIPEGDSVIPLSLGDGEYTIIAYEGMGEEGMYSRLWNRCWPHRRWASWASRS